MMQTSGLNDTCMECCKRVSDPTVEISVPTHTGHIGRWKAPRGGEEAKCKVKGE